MLNDEEGPGGWGRKGENRVVTGQEYAVCTCVSMCACLYVHVCRPVSCTCTHIIFCICVYMCEVAGTVLM